MTNSISKVDKAFKIFAILCFSMAAFVFWIICRDAIRYQEMANDVDFAACVYAQDFDYFNFSYDKKAKAWKARIEKGDDLKTITWSDDKTVQAIVLKTYCKK